MSVVRSYSTTDRILFWALAVPALAVLFFYKWGVVSGASGLAGWAGVDFFRLHFGYYALIALWTAFMLLRSTWQTGFRLTAAVLLSCFTVNDLIHTMGIQVTGTLAPSEVAYYLALAVGKAQVPIPIITFGHLVLVPALFVYLLSLKHRSLAPHQRSRAIRSWYVPMGASLALGLTGPLATELELNLSRPPHFYHLMRFVRGAPSIPEVPPENVKYTEGLVPRDSREAPGKNIVVIALESAGASAVGAYNPARTPVTPFLNELAGESVVVDRAYAVVPHTSKALVAINCGVEPFYRFPIFESLLGVPGSCLASLLRDEGYETVFFQSPTEFFENRRQLVEQFGFENFVPLEDMAIGEHELANYFGYEDHVMLEPSREWLEEREAPFFAFYLTGTPHHPYWPVSRYGTHEFEPEASSDNLNPYLNAVHYLDRFVKELIDQYRALGLYEDTIFVVVGDHGESIDTHGRYQHNTSLYEEGIRVPLILHGPELPHRRVADRLVSQVDIVPTLVDLLGFSLDGVMDGMSIFEDTGREAVFGTCWFDEWCLTRVTDRYKYIYNFSEKMPELYDLLEDPLETTNLATVKVEYATDARHDVLNHYEANIARYHRFYSERQPSYQNQIGRTFSDKMRLFRRGSAD